MHSLWGSGQGQWRRTLKNGSVRNLIETKRVEKQVTISDFCYQKAKFQIKKKNKITYFQQKHWESRNNNCHLSDLCCPWCRPSSVVQLYITSCLKISFPLTHENHCVWGTWLTGQNGGMRKTISSFLNNLA